MPCGAHPHPPELNAEQVLWSGFLLTIAGHPTGTQAGDILTPFTSQNIRGSELLTGSTQGPGQGTWNGLSWEANPSDPDPDSIARIFPECLSTSAFLRGHNSHGGQEVGVGVVCHTSPSSILHQPLFIRPLSGTSEQARALMPQPSSLQGPFGASHSPFHLYCRHVPTPCPYL